MHSGQSSGLIRMRGRRFFPHGVRLDVELVEDRRLGNGIVVQPYSGGGRQIDLSSSEAQPAALGGNKY
jgi:hypothetical protein